MSKMRANSTWGRRFAKPRSVCIFTRISTSSSMRRFWVCAISARCFARSVDLAFMSWKPASSFSLPEDMTACRNKENGVLNASTQIGGVGGEGSYHVWWIKWSV